MGKVPPAMILSYPPGSSGDVPNREIARDMIENMRGGSIITIPATPTGMFHFIETPAMKHQCDYCESLHDQTSCPNCGAPATEATSIVKNPALETEPQVAPRRQPRPSMPDTQRF